MIKQRTKEVLATMTDKELLAFTCLLGAKEAATGGHLQSEILMLRGGLAATGLSVDELMVMHADVSGSLHALTTAANSLLGKLEALLEEADLEE